jgi:hypothetical protein
MQSAARSTNRNEVIWLCPLQPLQRADGSQGGVEDYFDLFRPYSPWDFTAAHIRFFKIYPELVRSASDSQLRSLIAELSTRRISLALETPVLPEGAACHRGSGTSEAWMLDSVVRLKQLGADLAAIAMVGPLVDGYVTTHHEGCPRTMDSVAAEAAHIAANFRALYPRILIGDIEPIGNSNADPTSTDFQEWFRAWQTASGEPLAFLHVDTEWGSNWSQPMRDVAHEAGTTGIRFGVIYNGTRQDLSDAAFSRVALRHATQVGHALGHVPEDVVFQSWENFPRKALPDNDLSTMTGMVRAYLRDLTKLERGNSGSVRLSDLRTGAGIARANITLEVHDPPPEGAFQERILRGQTPHSAVSALLGLRIHKECLCSPGSATASFQDFSFRQDSEGREFTWNFDKWGTGGKGLLRPTMVDGKRALSVRAESTDTVTLNSPSFPVEPDKKFDARIRWKVEPISDDTGFLAIIFLGEDGKEIARTSQFLETTWRPLGDLPTGPSGEATIPPTALQQGSLIRLRFQGDLVHQPAELVLPGR